VGTESAELPQRRAPFPPLDFSARPLPTCPTWRALSGLPKFSITIGKHRRELFVPAPRLGRDVFPPQLARHPPGARASVEGFTVCKLDLIVLERAPFQGFPERSVEHLPRAFPCGGNQGEAHLFDCGAMKHHGPNHLVRGIHRDLSYAHSASPHRFNTGRFWLEILNEKLSAGGGLGAGRSERSFSRRLTSPRPTPELAGTDLPRAAPARPA
jgi:hypothetical protein